MSESSPIISRFDFNVICAGFTRLVHDVKLADRFWKHIDPEYFFFGDKSLKVRAFREILKRFKETCEAGEVTKVTQEYIGIRVGMTYDSEEGIEAKTLYSWMFSDESIRKIAGDEGAFGVFLDYIKVLHLLKWSKPFLNDYREGNVDSAIKSMQDVLPTLDQIKLAEDYRFSVEDVESMLPHDTNTVTDRLTLDCPMLDTQLGGFERQTLNVFLSVTNGGKSMMMMHLLRMCVQQKKTMHVTVVEDRPKSFARRLIACLTGISMWRLKNEFPLLTTQELEAIEKAKKDVKEYIRVDFIYGESVDSIHKRKLDYDLERKRLNLDPYLVDVIDYTGHIAHLSSGQKKYEQIHAAYSSRKNFALKHDKICFDFAQINREGLHRLENDDHFLTHADLAGGFDMSAVCDTIISINRTSNQRSANRATIYVCKGKDSEAGLMAKVKTDFARARWDMTEASLDLMSTQTRTDIVSQAVSEVKTGYDNIPL